MLYTLYELNHLAVMPLRAAAMAQSAMLRSPFNPAANTPMGRAAAAATDVFETVTRRYRKPEWHIPFTTVNENPVAVTPKSVWTNPWVSLVHFERNKHELIAAQGGMKADPKVLIVAPLSGHYATLLRGTVEGFLPDHEVYITDWADARMAPVIAGRFDLNDYVDHIMYMLRQIGPGAHVVGVCQPGPAVLAAVALMNEAGDPCAPRSMTFMGSPIDARRSPTAPNKLAEQRPLKWFKQNMIHTVPAVYPGAFRQVYPGFIQLASFMGMNWSRHVDAHWEYFENLTKGDGDNAGKHREFYDEYLSVLDLTEEFYLQTIEDVFQEYKLARSVFEHRGHRVDLAAIRQTALMTVEGERDDISGVGQTQAAHDLCPNIADHARVLHVQPKVGHYGVFNGKRFLDEIYPRIRTFIGDAEGQPAAKAPPRRARLRAVS
jgi:poly(3-hydroxybutyrate) depolymerase